VCIELSPRQRQLLGEKALEEVQAMASVDVTATSLLISSY